ncbi:hypothetical protein POM88_033268 [Heracleum sosnowskyi]|uniref:AMP-dependent synthetase/ligase domain-containing protein n=1 Tax=Heracleum sosnowskyi TaxID=360622 RepID=A0AAD8I1R9_9APIA|nr:hypothetical protein POM88_033268 [Heracleum sosnowskyi]
MLGDKPITVINTVNVRLNAGATSFLLEHSGSAVVMVDQEFFKMAEEERGAVEYEKFLETGDPGFPWKPPQDEWKTIALGYTSGTTASPKGVVLHHRGAYLMALSNVVIWRMTEGAVYLWTSPMFHCNGWCFPWTLAALCGTSICLRQTYVVAKHTLSGADVSHI